MKLRAATLDDAERLLEWRNDPLTREASVNMDPVPLEAHVGWLTASLQNPNRTLLVAEVDGRPVGTVRIDRGHETEMSWTVAPDARGRGFGKQMVSAAMPEGTVIAHIKAGNVASQKIAQSSGFTLTRDEALQRWERLA
ncbi:MAG: GNAT family N-acetyltransferase [Brevundimonas sp.]|uniref:GNAT family N-acetyltransferase n=1 Tax=Brevundimonas sp. TaxID=1871086 RepID=UPI00391D2CBA